MVQPGELLLYYCCKSNCKFNCQFSDGNNILLQIGKDGMLLLLLGERRNDAEVLLVQRVSKAFDGRET
jgi:hypothetical protein